MTELHDVAIAVAEIKTTLETHIAVSEVRDAKVDAVYKDVVIGNGKPSIKARLDSIEKNLPDFETWIEIRNWVKREKQIVWTLVSAVIMQTVILIFQFLK